MRRALITGVGGQDGGYLAEALLAEGDEVHALANVAEGPPAFCPPGVVLHEGDLADVEATRALVLEVEPTDVYNLAALSSVARSWADPDLTARVNGLGAVGLMESAFRLQERIGQPVSFVQASSAEIFGHPAVSPQDESTPLGPLNPYGAAKAYAHLMAGVYRSRGLHASSLILYNHESPRRGPEFVTSKIVRAAVAIADGRQDTLRLGNVEARRDWGWAPDVVDGFVRAARASVPDDYVLATGTARSVRDFAAAAFASAGVEDWERHLQIDAGFLRPADSPELVGDATKARTHLGWAPTIGFDDMVERLVSAERARHG